MKSHRLENTDFYGLRDFYHLIKYISYHFLRTESKENKDLIGIVKRGFERNFGGKLGAINKVEEIIEGLKIYNTDNVYKKRSK